MAKASDNPFPYVRVVPAAAPSSPPASSQYLYLDSGDSNKLKRKDSSGTVVTVEGGSGSGYGAWTTYTPTIAGQTSNPTMGTSSVLTGKYREDSETVEVEIYGKWGTGPTAGSGYYYFSLPVTPAASVYFASSAPVQAVGHGWHLDQSTGTQKQLIAKVFPDATHIIGYVDQATTIMGSGQPASPAVSDEFGFLLRYRK